jgi:CheY-like chemotaxis protein/GGDEF domain-containing protein
MSTDQPPLPPVERPVLDSVGLRFRLEEEVARVRRAGGFLSLAVIRIDPGPKVPPGGEDRVARAWRRLRGSVRLHDVLAATGSSLILVMPETNGVEAERAGERLLSVIRQEDVPAEGKSSPSDCAGVATAYGEVEGGGAALLAAAEDAMRLAAPGKVARSSTLQGRPRILVIDDDLAFAQVLAEMISERGWEAHPCSDMADARQRVKDRSYSGLFIDVVLPGVSGAEILRSALDAHPRRPAILMSGFDANHEAILEALGMGPVMFVHKPMSSADLDVALQMFRELVPGMVRRRRVPLEPSGPRP